MGTSQPVHLPEGYKLASEHEEALLLKRPDGTAVVAFELSAFGPDPRYIARIAWDDAYPSSQDDSGN